MKAEITFDQVARSYNGRSGCMCGCRGKYSIPSVDVLEAENKRCGWDAHNESNVNTRSIKIAIRKVNEALQHDPKDLQADGIDAGITNEYAWVDDGKRNTVVYFKQ